MGRKKIEGTKVAFIIPKSNEVKDVPKVFSARLKDIPVSKFIFACEQLGYSQPDLLNIMMEQIFNQLEEEQKAKFDDWKIKFDKSKIKE